MGSRKAAELRANPHAALCFHWKSLRRQVRVEGRIETVDDEEADAYFATRARVSQLGAWASRQSQPLRGRFELEAQGRQVYREVTSSAPVPRPPFWSGFRVVPAIHRILGGPAVPAAYAPCLPPRSQGADAPPAAAGRSRSSTRNGEAGSRGAAGDADGGRAADGARRRSERNERLKRWATTAAVAVAALLIAGKTGAYLATGAVSLLSSLINSLLDLLASLVNYVAIRQAAVPPDREHRFGHGKAEPLAGLAQAAFVAGSSVLLLFEAGSRLFRPNPIDELDDRHRGDGAVDRPDPGAGRCSSATSSARPARSPSAPTRCTTAATC